MKLSIVIPAYNEEEAIAAILDRSLRARASIVSRCPVDEVEVIVVSDGSTDRTAEIAATFRDAKLIVFERNRGYGAAIKRGFAESTGDLVGFLDADGTCDPEFFADLCSALLCERADVAIGSRLGPGSRMPGIRRLGNRAYALILSALSNKIVTDTASGMRVIRREALAHLYPLPNGLNFTPAISARVLMDDRLRIVECPMPYEERIGRSKLSVVRDGIRFLGTIIGMTLVWRPERLFFGAAAVALLIAGLLAMHPLEAWLRQGWFAEDRIYRLLFCSWLATVGLAGMSAGVLASLIRRMVRPCGEARSFASGLVDALFTGKGLAAISGPMAAAAVVLVGRGVWTRLTEGQMDQHWSRVVLAGLVAFAWCQILVTVIMAEFVRFHLRRAAEQTQLASRASVRTALQTPAQLPVGRADLPEPPVPELAAPA